MNTLEFLQTILPAQGVHFLALFKEGVSKPGHKSYEDLALMAEAIDNMAGSKSLSIYHACGAYLEHYVDGPDPKDPTKIKRQYRIAENGSCARSFWVDLDCGQEKFDKGQGYLTKSDACKTIFKFSDTIGWPRPMIVDSGNGLHGYWPMNDDLPRGEWSDASLKLKSALAHCGVIADPTRTADFASILRPINSFNRKDGGCKPVTLKCLGTPARPDELVTALQNFIDEHQVRLIRDTSKTPPVSGLNDDLTAHLPQYPDLPVDANEMAEGCAQVAAMRDTQGDVSYEHWRGVIGLLKHCVDGEALAESWSARREETGHSQVDWRAKYESWSSGPATCEFFQGCNASACEGCPLQGKIKTPLVLGRQMPENEPEVAEVIPEDSAEPIEVEIPALITGYTWDRGVMARLLPDKEGVLHAHPFSSILFYPTTRIRTEDGTFRIGVRMHLPSKKVRDFEMPAEAMASQTDMLRSMARYELMQSNHKDAGTHMSAYLRDQLEHLKRTVEEVNTLTNFGWRDDMSAFLLGDRLYHKDGTVRKVLVGGGAAKYKHAMPEPKGSLVKYASALNFMYNHEGMEHWQYAVCSGFGSILTPFGEELYNGLMVALQGGKTGKGKTTACFASMYAFGDANKMMLNSDEGYTQKALWMYLGTFNNLPVLLDELTNMEGLELSRAAYGVSNGKERIRLQSKGGSVTFADSSTWRMSPFITGNRDFHGVLAAHQVNSQAEAVRLIQVKVDRYGNIPPIDAELVQQAVETMKANMGTAGDALIRYVVTHQRQVADEIRTAMQEFAKYMPDPKYRFYRNHAACTLVAAQVCKNLGIVDFDLDRLLKYTLELLADLADTVATTNSLETEDAFVAMIADLSQRIMVTQEFRDKRSKTGPETPRNRLVGTQIGRYVMGSSNSQAYAGQLMVCQKTAREWCMSNRVDFHGMLESLQAQGALLKRDERVLLNRGTDASSPVQRVCLVVDFAKLDHEALTLVSNNTMSSVAGLASAGV